jgi:hypothetical protein
MGYGSTGFQRAEPHHGGEGVVRAAVDGIGENDRLGLLWGSLATRHDVALQVAFERQTLKPVFSLDRL